MKEPQAKAGTDVILRRVRSLAHEAGVSLKNKRLLASVTHSLTKRMTVAGEALDAAELAFEEIAITLREQERSVTPQDDLRTFHRQLVAECAAAHLSEHRASMERLAVAWEPIQMRYELSCIEGVKPHLIGTGRGAATDASGNAGDSQHPVDKGSKLRETPDTEGLLCADEASRAPSERKAQCSVHEGWPKQAPRCKNCGLFLGLLSPVDGTRGFTWIHNDIGVFCPPYRLVKDGPVLHFAAEPSDYIADIVNRVKDEYEKRALQAQRAAERDAAEIECVEDVLDTHNVPRSAPTGEVYSLHGRVSVALQQAYEADR